MGRLGREHLEAHYSFKQYGERWDKILSDVHHKYGSWETRQRYQTWAFKEL